MCHDDSVAVAELRIGSRRDLGRGEAQVVGSFVSQRHRFLEVAHGLDCDGWRARTRCSEWNAQELALHVLGATRACRSTLTGERAVFVSQSFDPRSGPKGFVEARAGEPVATTIGALEDALASVTDAVEGAQARSPAPKVEAVWGELVDWRLFVTHMFWDSWLHERDLLLPAGRVPVTDQTETRLAAAYGLLTAGLMAGASGVPFEATLVLSGAGSGRYQVTADGLDVTVDVTARLSSSSQGDAAAVTDALAGRGPRLGEVLDVTAEVVAVLSEVGSFLRGSEAEPPSDQD
jgi:Mycothiol maleylpyruvate isomerase N-terminal domain